MRELLLAARIQGVQDLPESGPECSLGLLEVSFFCLYLVQDQLSVSGGGLLYHCWCSDVLWESPLPLPLDLEAFKKLIAYSGKRKGGPAQKFVKKVDIPSVELPTDKTCRLALNLAQHGLIGKFPGLWPSLKAIDGWV